MKKSIKLSAIILVMFLVGTFQSKAIASTETPKSKTEIALEAKVLTTRLDEINALDKSTMSGKERRELRREVKSINNNLKSLNDGVYLSVGAIIIIVLLLILLL